MNINEFISNINKDKIAVASKFKVIVSPPAGLSGDMRELTFRINTTSMPTRKIRTEEVYNPYGSKYFGAVGKDYDQLMFTVLLSEDLKEREFFESWMDLIIGDSRTVDDEMHGIRYYDDYIGTISLVKYNEIDDIVAVTTYIEAYPIGLEFTGLNWETEEPMFMTVNIVYRKYKDTKS